MPDDNPTPQQDLALLLDAVQGASDIAAHHWHNGARSWDKGDGQGPVTEADLAVNTHLHDTLRPVRPAYGWLSEESDPLTTLDRLGHDTVFVVDPIDGTRAFIDGQKSFATALAVVRAGQPVAAVVHLPLMDLTYAASLGGGATLNGDPIAPTMPDSADPARILTTRPNLDLKHWPGGQPPLDPHFRASLAWRLALVAQGRFDAMLTLRATWDWDIAASALIAAEAGATVTDRTGGALHFNTAGAQSAGVLAAHAGLHARLLAGLTGPAQ